MIDDTAAVYGVSVRFVGPGESSAIVINGAVRLGTLLQKMRTHHERAYKAQSVVLGRFMFEPAESMLVAEKGESVVLTEKEAAILDCLIAADGAFITRKDLLTHVWGYVDGVETHTLETHIYRLRQKLETDPAQPEILLTEEQGYSLRF